MRFAFFILLSLFLVRAQSGTSIDPSGGRTSASSDNGCGIDPNGRCRGAGLDPNGLTAQSDLDHRGTIDPNG